MLSRASSRISSRSSDIVKPLTMLQTYVKRSIVLLQHGVFFQRYQLGGFCKLGILFLCCFGDEEPGAGQQVVNGCNKRKEHQEYAYEKIGAIQGPAKEDGGDHYEVDGNQRKGNRPVRESPVEEEVMDM